MKNITITRASEGDLTQIGSEEVTQIRELKVDPKQGQGIFVSYTAINAEVPLRKVSS